MTQNQKNCSIIGPYLNLDHFFTRKETVEFAKICNYHENKNTDFLFFPEWMKNPAMKHLHQNKKWSVIQKRAVL